jgi:hypothetical protein
MKLALVFGLLGLASCTFPDFAVSQEQPPPPTDACQSQLSAGTGASLDCQPACVDCELTPACTTNEECASGFCKAGVCSLASCNDGVKDRNETDVDCGGSDGCQACGVGQRCDSSYDCDGGACLNGRCEAPSCHDGLINQGETDADCGGETSCDRCTTGQHCALDADCDDASCAQGRCQPAGCEDGLKNGDETDVDCGGSCVTCPNFSGCKKSEDCTSAICNTYAGICLAATCNDGIQNGTEPATDCGKDCQSKCALTSVCRVDADCQSGSCGDGRCLPASPSGQALPMTGWVPTASAAFSDTSQPARAIDGNLGTSWESGKSQVPGMWFQIDMRSSKAVFAIEMTCSSNNDYARSVRALVSEDGQTYSPATSTVAGAKSLRLDFGRARVARYVKLELEQDTGGTWWRIDELRVLQ